jgi:hypothetical protein
MRTTGVDGLVDRLAERAAFEIRRHQRAIEASPSQLEAVTVELGVRADGRVSNVYMYVTHKTPMVRQPRSAEQPL